MSLLLVYPEEGKLYSDTRIVQGETYSDGHDKTLIAGNVTLAYVGTKRPLILAHQYVKHEWIQGKKSREVWKIAEDLAQRFGSDMETSIVIASQGRAWVIQDDYQSFEIIAPTAFGSGADTAAGLMALNLRPADVFATVSGCIYSVSSSFKTYSFR